jgi:N-acyl-D-amino-acid deacylase
MLIDGTGSPAIPRDVTIDGTRIAGTYKHSEGKASMIIDADGMVVCPGFIDIHSHSELHLLSNPLAESKIRQGVTTELVGNCGGSPAPAIGAAKDSLVDYAKILDIDVDWATLDEYFLRLSNLRTSVNVASLVGASNLRLSVMGAVDAKPDDDQLQRMNRLLADSMLAGAYGLSSGLIYAPGCYASTEELVSLSSTCSSLGGFYSSHIRGEGRTLIKAVEEAIRIGREAGARVEISHHKACGRANWGAVDRTLDMIEDAREGGVDVAFDVYPYTASSTTLDSILPPWAREGTKEEILSRLRDPQTRQRVIQELSTPSEEWEAIAAETGWDCVVLVGFQKEANKRFENRSVADIAKDLGKDPSDIALDLIIDEELMVYAIFHEISEEDMMKVLSHPLATIGSDGEAEAPYGPTGKSATHPRAYGTFPRVLRRYALDKRLFTLEEAVRKMTSLPAERIGLKDRGTIAKGMAADIVVFDPRKILDLATFELSHVYPAGVELVLVNGAVTISHGGHTKERAGHVLRHQPNVS